jgi:hypothetical protein
LFNNQHKTNETDFKNKINELNSINPMSYKRTPINILDPIMGTHVTVPELTQAMTSLMKKWSDSAIKDFQEKFK